MILFPVHLFPSKHLCAGANTDNQQASFDDCGEMRWPCIGTPLDALSFHLDPWRFILPGDRWKLRALIWRACSPCSAVFPLSWDQNDSWGFCGATTGVLGGLLQKRFSLNP